MIRNTTPVTAGDTVVVCHVPEHDYPAGLFHWTYVERVLPNGQLITADGCRMGLGSVWPTMDSLRDALDAQAAIESADARLLRYAR